MKRLLDTPMVTVLKGRGKKGGCEKWLFTHSLKTIGYVHVLSPVKRIFLCCSHKTVCGLGRGGGGREGVVHTCEEA